MVSSLKLVTLCTGNVARSVMLGYMLESLAQVGGFDWSIRTAGTHVVEGSAMSSRTRDALQSLDDLGEHHYGSHRSHQLSSEDVAWADVILTSEANHVLFVRSNFPGASSKSVLFHQFVREAPLDLAFNEQLRVVATREPLATYDVDDPAAGDQATYNACATKLWKLAQIFSTIADEES
ncbi:MAG: arsenate reductase/protein-tyrosine-phosphatase family protein [Acidimicrobiales bacterium]